MAIPTPFDSPIAGKRSSVKGTLGPGKTRVSFNEKNYGGLPVVPYAPNTGQVTWLDASAVIDYGPQILVCDASNASFSVQLPQASGCLGTTITVLKVDSTVNTISFTTELPCLLKNYTTWTALTKQYETVTWLAVLDSLTNPIWIAMLSKPVV